MLQGWGVRGRIWGRGGMHKPGYLGRGAGAGGSFVSLETGPCCVSSPFVPLCPFPPPRPSCLAAGPHLGLQRDGPPPPPPPPLLPGPSLLPGELRCIPLPGRAARLRRGGVGWEGGGGRW